MPPWNRLFSFILLFFFTFCISCASLIAFNLHNVTAQVQVTLQDIIFIPEDPINSTISLIRHAILKNDSYEKSAGDAFGECKKSHKLNTLIRIIVIKSMAWETRLYYASGIFLLINHRRDSYNSNSTSAFALRIVLLIFLVKHSPSMITNFCW